MAYKYWGVFCSGKFIALWDQAMGVSAGVPKLDLNGPTLVKNCPGCQKDHTFQPEELKLVGDFPDRQPLRDYQEQGGE
jgi:hypothetical protein